LAGVVGVGDDAGAAGVAGPADEASPEVDAGLPASDPDLRA
jgi:hypothetical protein